jgi:polysaccharide pyruvyl transferase WcaK-like protein
MEYPKDLDVSRKVIAAMKEKAYLLENRYNPPQILGIVGRLDLMLSMRLHTLIFAAVKNVPMLGIIYDPKVEYYLKVLEMPEAGDVRAEHIDVDKATSRALDIFANMSGYKAILKKNSDIMMDKANENDRLLNKQLDIIRDSNKK